MYKLHPPLAYKKYCYYCDQYTGKYGIVTIAVYNCVGLQLLVFPSLSALHFLHIASFSVNCVNAFLNAVD